MKVEVAQTKSFIQVRSMSFITPSSCTMRTKKKQLDSYHVCRYGCLCLPFQSAARRHLHTVLRVLTPQHRSCPAVITTPFNFSLKPKVPMNLRYGTSRKNIHCWCRKQCLHWRWSSHQNKMNESCACMLTIWSCI